MGCWQREYVPRALRGSKPRIALHTICMVCTNACVCAVLQVYRINSTADTFSLVRTFRHSSTGGHNRRHNLTTSSTDIKCHPHWNQRFLAATSAANGAVSLWAVRPEGGASSAHGGGQRGSCHRHTQSASRVAWNGSALFPDVLASCSKDHSVRIWDAANLHSKGDCALTINVGEPVSDIAWDPYRPHYITAASEGGRIRVFDIRHIPQQRGGGRGAPPMALSPYAPDTSLPEVSPAVARISSAHSGLIYGLAWHPCVPGVMASCGRDRAIKLWGMWGEARTAAQDGTPMHLSSRLLSVPSRPAAATAAGGASQPAEMSAIRCSHSVRRVAWRPGIHRECMHISCCIIRIVFALVFFVPLCRPHCLKPRRLPAGACMGHHPATPACSNLRFRLQARRCRFAVVWTPRGSRGASHPHPSLRRGQGGGVSGPAACGPARTCSGCGTRRSAQGAPRAAWRR